MSTARSKNRTAILEAAFAVFSERPGATLSDVAARADVGRATLHRHFPARADLMRALSRVAADELERAVEEATATARSAEEGLYLSLHAIVPLANRQWFLAQDWLDTDPDLAAAYEQDQEELRAAIEDAKDEGAFARDVPTTWLAEAYENLIYAAWSVVRSGEASPKDAADLAWRTLKTGLKGQTL
ncbi:MAG: helix-turn-helix domain-containing protein [Pseudomonadota bacterium]